MQCRQCSVSHHQNNLPHDRGHERKRAELRPFATRRAFSRCDGNGLLGRVQHAHRFYALLSCKLANRAAQRARLRLVNVRERQHLGMAFVAAPMLPTKAMLALFGPRRQRKLRRDRVHGIHDEVNRALEKIHLRCLRRRRRHARQCAYRERCRAPWRPLRRPSFSRSCCRRLWPAC